MSTVIAFEYATGAILAADRTLVSGGSIRSRDRQRVYGRDEWGIAVATDDVTAVRDRVDAGIREYSLSRDTPRINPVERIVASVAEQETAEIVVAARDEDGDAGIRAIRSDGSVLADSPVAMGSGAALALGQLEAASMEIDDDKAISLARETITGAAERDAGTGSTVDVWTLQDQ